MEFHHLAFSFLSSTLMCSGCSYHSRNTTEKFDHTHCKASNESGHFWKICCDTDLPWFLSSKAMDWLCGVK